MGAFQPIHLLFIAVIFLVLFGGSKIPQFMRGLGQGTGEFKKGLEESKNEPPPPPAVASSPVNVPQPAPPAEAPK